MVVAFDYLRGCEFGGENRGVLAWTAQLKVPGGGLGEDA